MGLSQQHQRGKCVVVGHWKACNNRGRLRQGWMALSCVTSPASLGLLRPIWCACMHAHTHSHTHSLTHTHWRAGTRERKGIVNRKHAGLTRDWEVILDRWPLDVFCFCFTLKFLRKAFDSAAWLLPCKESWEIGAELLPLVGVFFSWIVYWGRMAGKKWCVFVCLCRGDIEQDSILTTKETIYLWTEPSLG